MCQLCWNLSTLLREETMNHYDMIKRVLDDNNALLPIDVAAALVNEGFDISELDSQLDGYSIDDFVTRYEEMYG